MTPTLFGTIGILGVLLATAAPVAQAAMYKCPRDGGYEYTDQPCGSDPRAHQFRPKQPLSTVTAESLTGRKAAPVDKRPAWLKGPDPVGDCLRKGGEIDKEMRACRLP